MSRDPIPGGARVPGMRAIVERQPVGTLIVDGETVVRYANPAAADLLGVAAERLVGEMFGLPVLSGGVTEVNVAAPGGSVRTLALRATDLPQTPDGRLISLFDISSRARRYEYEHRVVESLQRSLLLDRMPALPGIALAARYLPGEGEIRVGGDWYDVIPLPGGRLGLVIGDVVGHGVESAALMSQLRNALRAYALEHESPARVLSGLDTMLFHLEPSGMATAIYLIYDPAASSLTFAAAGHPYPLVARPDGENAFLTGGRSVPLGIGYERVRTDSTVSLPSVYTLALYTDGLIERRRRPLDDGFAALSASLDPRTDDPEVACDRILSALLGSEAPTDDVAVLVMCADARAAAPPPGGD